MEARVDERLDTLITMVGELRGQVAELRGQVSSLNTRVAGLEDRWRHTSSGNLINWNIILVALIVAISAATFTWFVSVAR